jgi:hypothetical protein
MGWVRVEFGGTAHMPKTWFPEVFGQHDLSTFLHLIEREGRSV